MVILSKPAKGDKGIYETLSHTRYWAWKFHLPASNCFDTAQEKPKGTGFSPVGGTSRGLILIQGGHFWETYTFWENSLSFLWDFQGIFKFFPEQLKREICCDKFLFAFMPHILTFSLSFAGFSSKIEISLCFPWDSHNFSNSQCFPGLWPPCWLYPPTIISRKQ